MSFATLIQIVDALEDAADGYLTLDQVRAAGASDISEAVDALVLLVDYRTRADGTDVTLCRLNRRHPDVVRLTVQW
ncbi:MAG TPA: hypothetical protein VGJ60_11695 [Chloroflexota bacterium]